MYIPPMLLQKREDPFDDPRYVFEPKIDGIRCILAITGGQVRLYSRHKTDMTRQFPELHDVPTRQADVILDGEVAAIDFETTMSRFQARNPARAAALNPVVFYAFDVLRIGAWDVRKRPLTERKALLNDVLADNAHFSRVLSVEGTGCALFDVIKSRAMEGIVAKRKDSVYVGRRSDNWLKIINYTYADVRIAGWRKDTFGWLTEYDGRSSGIIELAVPAAHRAAFYRVAKSIVTAEDRENVYVEPLIKARVRFRNWTKRGMLRSPEFVRFIL